MALQVELRQGSDYMVLSIPSSGGIISRESQSWASSPPMAATMPVMLEGKQDDRAKG